MKWTASCQNPDFSADDLAGFLETKYRARCPDSEDAWDRIGHVCRTAAHNFPCDLSCARIFPTRVPVVLSVYKGGSRNALVETLLGNPFRVYVVMDSHESGFNGLYLAVSDPEESLVISWLRRASPARMVIGERNGMRMLVVPLKSYLTSER